MYESVLCIGESMCNNVQQFRSGRQRTATDDPFPAFRCVCCSYLVQFVVFIRRSDKGAEERTVAARVDQSRLEPSLLMAERRKKDA